MFAAQGVDVDAPRAKRHKASASSPTVAKEDVGAMNGNGGEEVVKMEDVQDEPVVVKEKGLKLWQTIKDAVNKECVTVLWLFQLQQFGNSSHLPQSTSSNIPLFVLVFHLQTYLEIIPTLLARLLLRPSQRTSFICRLPPFTLQAAVPRLLRTNQATNSS